MKNFQNSPAWTQRPVALSSGISARMHRYCRDEMIDVMVDVSRHEAARMTTSCRIHRMARRAEPRSNGTSEMMSSQDIFGQPRARCSSSESKPSFFRSAWTAPRFQVRSGLARAEGLLGRVAPISQDFRGSADFFPRSSPVALDSSRSNAGESKKARRVVARKSIVYDPKDAFVTAVERSQLSPHVA